MLPTRSTHPLWRLATLSSGVLFVWVAVGSPLAVLDHQLLTAHMMQHLLLTIVAAPLILMGAPAIRLRVHPVLCWLASTAVVIGWHIPALFKLAMQSNSWHAVEHGSFLAAGLLFWWPVIGRVPRWSVLLYLFLATLPCDALSAFLTFCGRIVYPHYLHAPGLFGLSPLGDQEFAGALMWIAVTFAYLAPAASIAIRLLEPGARGRPNGGSDVDTSSFVPGDHTGGDT
jgi:putative membrane protein